MLISTPYSQNEFSHLCELFSQVCRRAHIEDEQVLIWKTGIRARILVRVCVVPAGRRAQPGS